MKMKMKNNFCCPVCKGILNKNENSYCCAKNHSFDIAKSGYVNLLLSNQMNAKNPGDNKLMVKARTDFLNKGYYSPLAEKLSEIIKEICKENMTILDAGCGEGYYTSKVYENINKNTSFFGIDISKNALAVASKRNININYAVASIFHIPFSDCSCDIVMTLFAPFCREEIYRILKKDGTLVMVIPSENHLWSFKRAIYDKPYKNEVKDTKIEGFELTKKELINNIISLESNEDIKNLFSMTPYYYKTGTDGSKKVSELNSLETEIEFEILVYKKK